MDLKKAGIYISVAQKIAKDLKGDINNGQIKIVSDLKNVGINESIAFEAAKKFNDKQIKNMISLSSSLGIRGSSITAEKIYEHAKDLTLTEKGIDQIIKSYAMR
jgi:hypothetical protein